MEKKPQRNFQTDFIKLMLEHNGDSTEERKALWTDLGAVCAWLLLQAGNKAGFLKRQACLHEKAGL